MRKSKSNSDKLQGMKLYQDLPIPSIATDLLYETLDMQKWNKCPKCRAHSKIAFPSEGEITYSKFYNMVCQNGHQWRFENVKTVHDMTEKQFAEYAKIIVPRVELLGNRLIEYAGEDWEKNLFNRVSDTIKIPIFIRLKAVWKYLWSPFRYYRVDEDFVYDENMGFKDGDPSARVSLNKNKILSSQFYDIDNLRARGLKCTRLHSWEVVEIKTQKTHA